MSETKVDTLVINELSKAQYDGITPSDTELYFINDTLDPQYTTMPTAVSKYVNQITQYVGVSDSNYTNGYFYKCIKEGEDELTISQTSGGSLKDITINKDVFLAKEQPTSSKTINFVYDFNNSTWTKNGSAIVISEYGVAYDGMPGNGDTLTAVYNIGSLNYKWEQTNVQPSAAVQSVNGKVGDVVLDGEDINATVDSTTNTITNHLETLYEEIDNTNAMSIIDWGE